MQTPDSNTSADNWTDMIPHRDEVLLEDIEIFNKKAIYLYLREITGLNTKQIVNSLKKFRKKYYLFKNDWEGGSL